jgi:hydrogenase 3 maturation protease
MSSDLSSCLQAFLSGATRVAVLGVGSEDRGDDGVGMRVASLVKAMMGESRWVRVFQGHTAPENLTGEIKGFGPSHLLVVDAARLGTEPGKAAFLSEDQIGGAPLATHTLPLGVMFSYLRDTFPKLKIGVVGIEPGDTAFGKRMSVGLELAAVAAFAAIAEAIWTSIPTPDS